MSKIDNLTLLLLDTYPPKQTFYMPKIKRYGKSVQVRTTDKIGRNQICSCGSGKKYKKCCLLTNKN